MGRQRLVCAEGRRLDSHLTLSTSDQALFCNTTFGGIFKATLREMESDYGIIPYPKHDETQTTYYSRVEGGCPYSVPSKRVIDTSFAGAMMEASSVNSYISVIPVYYETALKTKYSRDEQSGKILDMMMSNRVYDWGDTFFTSYVRDGFVFKAFNNGKPVSASDIESNKKKVDAAIEKVVKAVTREGFLNTLIPPLRSSLFMHVMHVCTRFRSERPPFVYFRFRSHLPPTKKGPPQPVLFFTP